MEKHAVAQEQITALVDNATGEGLVSGINAALAVNSTLVLLTPGYFRDVAFVNMRRELLDATRDLETVRRRMQDLERDAADRERELLRLKTDRTLQDYLYESGVCDGDGDGEPFANTGPTVDAIGQEQMAALAVLKSSDELISESLRTELEATRKQLAQRVFELDRMKDQLMGALVSKDKVQKRLDDALASSSSSPAATAPEEAAAQAKGKKEDAEKIDKLKAALKQKVEVSDDPGPRIDSPYMASFLGLRFFKKQVLPPSLPSPSPLPPLPPSPSPVPLKSEAETEPGSKAKEWLERILRDESS
jgi:protein HOOK3